MTTVTQLLMTSLVVTPCERLDPSPGVSGCLHNLGCAFAQADEPEDLVVAAKDGIVGFAVTALQLLWTQVRVELYSLWHNAPLYTRTWYKRVLLCVQKTPIIPLGCIMALLGLGSSGRGSEVR